jgi:hypothetical protein
MPFARSLNRLVVAVAVVAAGPAILSTQLFAQQPYKILDKWKLGGDGGWDYLLAGSGANIDDIDAAAVREVMAYDSAADRVYLVSAQFGPRPGPTAENPRPRPPVLPGTFTVIVVGR